MDQASDALSVALSDSAKGIDMIVIDMNTSTPVFQQLVQQVKQAVQQSELAPGDPLPSIRQLAGDLDINAKTVAKAYKLLERDGVIESRGYRGTHVHSDALAHCRFDIGHLLLTELDQCIQSLKARGATDPELRQAFNQLLNGTAQMGKNDLGEESNVAG